MDDAVFRSVKRICYAGLDSVTLRREVAARIAPSVPFDAHAFGTADPDTGLLTHVVADGVPAGLFVAYSHWLYPEHAAIAFIDAFQAGRTVVHLEDEIPEAKEVMNAAGLTDVAHVVITAGGGLWGKWCLMREHTRFDVGRGEQGLLERLAPHLGRGLRAAALVDRATAPGPSGPNTPGILALDARRRPILRTPALTPMLEDLADVGVSAPGGVPIAILNVVNALHCRYPGVAQDDTPGESTLRARGRSGRWYLIRASVAEPDETGESASVVVVRPIGPREMAPILTRLYGLSLREREVAAALARGESTKRIAARLGISPHTVKEHVDRACEKIGVRGRRALVARLYFDACAPKLMESA